MMMRAADWKHVEGGVMKGRDIQQSQNNNNILQGFPHKNSTKLECQKNNSV